MADIEIFGKIKENIKPTSEWELENPILLKNEKGIEVIEDTGFRIKVGDGLTNWSELKYIDSVLDISNIITAQTFNDINFWQKQDNLVFAKMSNGNELGAPEKIGTIMSIKSGHFISQLLYAQPTGEIYIRRGNMAVWWTEDGEMWRNILQDSYRKSNVSEDVQSLLSQENNSKINSQLTDITDLITSENLNDVNFYRQFKGITIARISNNVSLDGTIAPSVYGVLITNVPSIGNTFTQTWQDIERVLYTRYANGVGWDNNANLDGKDAWMGIPYIGEYEDTEHIINGFQKRGLLLERSDVFLSGQDYPSVSIQSDLDTNYHAKFIAGNKTTQVYIEKKRVEGETRYDRTSLLLQTSDNPVDKLSYIRHITQAGGAKDYPIHHSGFAMPSYYDYRLFTTSTALVDIVEAMPKYSHLLFEVNGSHPVYTNPLNKMPHAGVYLDITMLDSRFTIQANICQGSPSQSEARFFRIKMRRKTSTEAGEVLGWEAIGTN